jgi:hypothetical protein
VPTTKPAVGHAAPEASSVHHGTPNSSAMMAKTSAQRRQYRRVRRGGSTDSTTSAGLSVITADGTHACGIRPLRR